MKSKDVVEVKRAANIRRYVYVATLSKKTGRLLHITAGCQKWKTFQEAYSHYNRPPRWSDAHLGDDCHLLAQRTEARSLLQRLMWDVQSKQYLIRRHNKAQRRAR